MKIFLLNIGGKMVWWTINWQKLLIIFSNSLRNRIAVKGLNYKRDNGFGYGVNDLTRISNFFDNNGNPNGCLLCK